MLKFSRLKSFILKDVYNWDNLSYLIELESQFNTVIYRNFGRLSRVSSTLRPVLLSLTKQSSKCGFLQYGHDQVEKLELEGIVWVWKPAER